MIQVAGVTKAGGHRMLFRNASMQINPGEKIGLVGPNGAGKTTLFRLISGQENPDEGQVSRPERISVGYFSQDVAEMKGRSALAEVMAVRQDLVEIRTELLQLESQLSEELSDDVMASTLERYGILQTAFEQSDGYELESRAATVLTGLGIAPDQHGAAVESFSGGWKMRIALAKILTLNPDVLLMDEPTNHLDLESIVWLEQWISQFEGALLMTSHDRDFMNRLVSKIVEIGQLTLTTYNGNYDFYAKEKEIRKVQLIASAKRQDDMLAKERDFIARFQARASHAAQVQSRVKKLDKIDLIEVPKELDAVKFQWINPASRSGDEVVKLSAVSKSYTTHNGQQRTVLNDVTSLVKRLDRIAVVGVNGAGKSTLLKMIAGFLSPSQGEVKLGASVQMGYFSQNSLDVLDPSLTILEQMQQDLPTLSLGVIRNILGAFLFSGEDVDKKISILSGGEKSRVVLATLFSKPINFLVLDEPTNHLDIETRQVLLDAFAEFQGTLMIVSHDRHFLRSLVNKVLFIHDQSAEAFECSWDEFAEKQL